MRLSRGVIAGGYNGKEMNGHPPSPRSFPPPTPPIGDGGGEELFSPSEMGEGTVSFLSKMGGIWFFVVAFFFVAAVAGAGGIDPAGFSGEAQRGEYAAAIKRLRCMVCQNQTLAESDAPLAGDMRAIAREMAREGKTGDEIVEFMVLRYGDFVVYRPPFDLRTLPLWLAPFLLAAFALAFLPGFLRRRALADDDAEARRGQ